MDLRVRRFPVDVPEVNQRVIVYDVEKDKVVYGKFNESKTLNKMVFFDHSSTKFKRIIKEATFWVPIDGVLPTCDICINIFKGKCGKGHVISKSKVIPAGCPDLDLRSLTEWL